MAAAFLCDGMVGHLSRWLRLMGFDAEYAGNLLTDDDVLAWLSREPRVLLTRDEELFARARRRNVPAVLVPEAPLEDELLAALRGSRIEPDASRWLTRCTTCNGQLVEAPLDEVRERVPEPVRGLHSEYQRCTQCGQVYWEGTHVEPIRATLENVMRRLTNLD